MQFTSKIKNPKSKSKIKDHGKKITDQKLQIKNPVPGILSLCIK